MFRGSEQAKIDDKGRLKIPARFRQKLFENFGPQVFMTTDDDGMLVIYPIKVWNEKESRMTTVPDTLQSKKKFFLTRNILGTEKTVDDQGRLPIPAALRESTNLKNEILVVGYLNTLVLMSAETAKQWIEEMKPTASDYEKLQEYGI